MARKKTPEKGAVRTTRTLPDIGKKESFEFSRRDTGTPPAKNRSQPVSGKARTSAPAKSSPPARKPAKLPDTWYRETSTMPRKGMTQTGVVNPPKIEVKKTTPPGKDTGKPSTKNVGFKPSKSKPKACGPGSRSAKCPKGAPKAKRR